MVHLNQLGKSDIHLLLMISFPLPPTFSIEEKTSDKSCGKEIKGMCSDCSKYKHIHTCSVLCAALSTV